MNLKKWKEKNRFFKAKIWVEFECKYMKVGNRLLLAILLFLSSLWFIDIFDKTEIQTIDLRLFNGPKSWLGQMLCYIMQNHKKHNSTNKCKNTLQNYKNQKNGNICFLSHNFWTNLDLFHLFILVIKPYLSAH